MQSLLNSLHIALQTIPLLLQLVALSVCALGWLGAHIVMEYGETLHRPAVVAPLLARVCGGPALLLLVALLADNLWAREYAHLRLLGAVALVIVLVAGIGRSASRTAAHEYLVTEGYEQGLPPQSR
jgi:hypothetical protein